MKPTFLSIAVAWRCVLAIGFLTSSLAGCTRPAGAQKELLFAFWGSVEQQKLEQSIIRAFEEENPDIKVRILPIGQRYTEKVQAMMVADAAPDIFFVEMGRYDEWASRGVLKDVTPLMERLSGEDALLPLPRKAFERNGQFYAAPISVHGYIMYCNLDALKEAGIPFSPSGWSWDQIREMAPKLSRRHGDPNAPTDYAILMPPLEVVLPSYGASFFDRADHPTKVNADTPEIRAAFSDYGSFIRDGFAAPPDVTSAQGTFELFRDGRVAFFFSGRWSTPEFVGKTKFDWDVVPVPAGKAGSITMHGGTSMAIWEKTRLPKEAERFVQFYAGRKGALLAMRGGRNMPVYESLAYGKEMHALRPPESIYRFADTMLPGAATISLYSIGYADFQRCLTRRLDQFISRGDSLDSVLAGLQSDLERWLQRRQARAIPTSKEP